MYCPACDKNFGPVHSRCPECDSWLRVSGPEAEDGGHDHAAQGAPGTGSQAIDWAAPASHGGWGGSRSAPAAPGDQWLGGAASGWGQSQAPPSAGWLGGDSGDGGSGWHPARTPQTSGWLGGGGPEGEGDGWGSVAAPAEPLSALVDEALESDEDPEEDWDEIPEDEVSEPLDLDEVLTAVPQPSPYRWVAVVLVVLLVGGGLFLLRPASGPEVAGEPPQSAAGTSDVVVPPEILLGSAAESAGEGMFEVAAAQAATAVDLLARSGGDPAALADARLSLASYSMEAGDFATGLEQYRQLSRAYPDDATYAGLFDEALQRAEKAGRIEANEAYEEATSLFAAGEFNSALQVAREALDLYEENRGSRAQLASAHALMGRSLSKLRSYGQAEEHLAAAVEYDPSVRQYRQDLAAVSTYTTPQVETAPAQPRVIVVKPEPKNYPTKRTRIRRRASRPQRQPERAAAAPQPASPSRPRTAAPPPAPRKREAGLRPPGGESGLKSYYNTYKSAFDRD